MDISSNSRKITKTEKFKKSLFDVCDVLEQEFICHYDELLFNECMNYIRNNANIIELCNLYYKLFSNKYTFLQQIHITMKNEEQKRKEKNELYNANNIKKLIEEWKLDPRSYCPVTEYHRAYYSIEHPPYKPLVAKKHNGIDYHAFCICENKIHKNASAPYCAAINKKQNPPINYVLLFTEALTKLLAPGELYKSLICGIYNQKLKNRKTDIDQFPFIINSVYDKIYHMRIMRESHIKTASSFPHNLIIFEYNINATIVQINLLDSNLIDDENDITEECVIDFRNREENNKFDSRKKQKK
jgi:hypothetical protein